MASDLTPYIQPLTRRTARHLACRSGLGVAADTLAELSGQDPATVVTNIVAQAQASPLPPTPEWVDAAFPEDRSQRREYNQQNQTWLQEYRAQWFAAIAQGGLRERLALFWHNHFVVEAARYGNNAPLTYRYLTLIRQHALGNFRDFVRAIGLTPAMLLYLDGARNHRNDPNENYARELLELFTMGRDAYTEADIVEVARALTGYIVNGRTLSTEFNPRRFDDGSKTFFGRTGAFGYDDLIDILFAERPTAIARFISRKLYRFFVYDDADEEVVEALAQILLDADFAIAPVVKTLLASGHFFNAEFIGAQIKSPMDFFQGLYSTTDRPLATDQRNIRRLGALEQNLFNPPDVAGWPGHHRWISTTTLPLRWSLASSFVSSRQIGRPDLVAVAKKMPAPNDPYQLVADLSALWLAVDLPPQEQENLIEILLGGIPDYEWYIDTPGADTRLLILFNHITQLPEYQLN